MRQPLTTILTLICITGHSADDLRHVSVERLPKMHSVLLAIRSDALSITFNQRHAWNVAEIRFKEHVIGQHTGATGTVIH